MAVSEDLTLSGLLAEPDGPPRGLLFALHGHGMTARYFAGPADREGSLLELGAELGFVVWAPDRIGYGISAGADPAVFAMIPQAALLGTALDDFAMRYDAGAGAVLVGHSFGLKLALAMAAAPPSTPILGVEGSGGGLVYTFEPGVSPPIPNPGDVNPSWGPRHLYPPRSFDRDVRPTAPMAPPPKNEVVDWPDDLRAFAGRIQVPVRFTFGDHERLWEISDAHFDALRAILPSAPRVECAVQQHAGHNVSLANSARAYHLKVLAFAEECLVAARPPTTEQEVHT